MVHQRTEDNGDGGNGISKDVDPFRDEYRIHDDPNELDKSAHAAHPLFHNIESNTNPDNSTSRQTIGNKTSSTFQQCPPANIETTTQDQDFDEVIHAIEKQALFLQEENDTLWELIEATRKAFRVIWKRDVSIVQGIAEAAERCENQRPPDSDDTLIEGMKTRSSSKCEDDLKGSAESAKSEGCFGRDKGGPRRRNSFASLRSYFSFYRHEDARLLSDPLPSRSKRSKWSVNGSLKSRSRRNASDEATRSPDNNQEDWKEKDAHVPTLAQELRALLGFGEINLERLREDIDEFAEREKYCKGLRTLDGFADEE
ncbi:unnamed protein product [Periconia digitata]|uniref:Uncharacterized protein n=1 Tax=Periconia digitata TaxID=1303443 RepID=A0A9W4U6K1_9PLEO|nr:unnamed protein product [Periconia digitata]